MRVKRKKKIKIDFFRRTAVGIPKMSKDLNKVLEFVETLSTKERINDGEYLDMMNCLKGINDSIKKNSNDTEEEEDNHYINTRYAIYTRMKLKYFTEEARPNIDNTVTYSRPFEDAINCIENNLPTDDRYVNDALEFYLPHLKEKFANFILYSKHSISKNYKKHILTQNLHWKYRLSIFNKLKPIIKLNKDDMKDKKNCKSHIIKVDIKSPIKETFCMPTKFIRLGNELNGLSTDLNFYIISKYIVDKPLTIKYIRMINREGDDVRFNLEVSGIDAKTRNKKRQYSYTTGISDTDIQYHITYLTK